MDKPGISVERTKPDFDIWLEAEVDFSTQPVEISINPGWGIRL